MITDFLYGVAAAFWSLQTFTSCKNVLLSSQRVICCKVRNSLCQASAEESPRRSYDNFIWLSSFKLSKDDRK